MRDDGQMSFNQNPDDIGNGLEMQSMTYNNEQDQDGIYINNETPLGHEDFGQKVQSGNDEQIVPMHGQNRVIDFSKVDDTNYDMLGNKNIDT